MPTPCCVAPLGGMAVPGTPSLIVRNKSASEFPWRFCARVRSGPRPPPRAPKPWQNAQFERNWYSPSFATFVSPANGFFSCARSVGVVHQRNTVAINPPTIAHRLFGLPKHFEWAWLLDSLMILVTLVTLEDSHRMPISLSEQTAIVDFGNYTT